MNSNYTLKFPRSYREATGHDCRFERTDPDRLVGRVMVILFVFLAGVLVGAA